jgi:amidophosphoribosyltransferase
VCGVFGIWSHPEAAKLAYLGLHALQHRGQEAAGIVAAGREDQRYARHLGRGLVADVFTETTLTRLAGQHAIGHVRYSTAGGTGQENAQPFSVQTSKGPLALAHNGNLVNAKEIRETLEREGAIFSTPGDSEVFVHLLARARAPRLVDRVREAAAQVIGAYTLIMMHAGGMIGVRDPEGFRPLVLGELNGAHVLASETSALELIGATFLREVKPGEIVSIDKNGVHSERLVHAPDARPCSCVFELVYFARPDSSIFERSVYEARVKMGKHLAEEQPAEADLVVPVPDSGVPAALGFAEASGIPFRHGLLRSHYVGRTFIEPEQSIRHFGVKLKLSPIRSVLEGKRVVVVDDSIVRGTTSRKIVGMLRSAGAKEVHLRISSPPSRYPCFYGIDTPTRTELIAAQKSVEETRDFITADSLGYLSEAGLHAAANDAEQERFCNACFTGRYTSGRELIEPRLVQLPSNA